MGKSLAILAAGLFLITMGCQNRSGSAIEDTYHDHLYAGQTVQLLCRAGEPVQQTGIEPYNAAATCRDEYDEQVSSRASTTRLLLVVGALTFAYGAFEFRRVRAG